MAGQGCERARGRTRRASPPARAHVAGHSTGPGPLRRVRPLVAGLALSGTLFAAAPALEARPLRPGETVLDRPRPEMTEHGGRLGRLWVRPTLTTALAFDDNVFANDDQRRSDFLLRTRPEVGAEADWRGHRAEVRVAAEQGRYLAERSEDYLDLDGEAYGRLQATRELHASATARWGRGHVPRRSVESPADAVEPTVFRTRSGELQIVHRAERSVLRARLAAREIDYDDVAARAGGTINNDDRDHWVGELEVAERVPLTLRVDAFARTRIDLRLYATRSDDAGFARDSYGHATVAGLTWRPTGLTTIEAYLGALQRVYADPRFARLIAPTAGLQVTTSPSQLTSLRLALDQSVRETGEPAASGRLVTSLTARVDHELRRDLLASLEASYADDDYRGLGRRDGQGSVGLNLTYLASRHLHARLSVRHDRRSSNVSSARTFRRNRIEVGVEVRY